VPRPEVIRFSGWQRSGTILEMAAARSLSDVVMNATPAPRPSRSRPSTGGPLTDEEFEQMVQTIIDRARAAQGG